MSSAALSNLMENIHACSAQEAERDDIYQLGVILLEIITGKQVTSESELDELKLQVFIQLQRKTTFFLPYCIYYIKCYPFTGKFCLLANSWKGA